jgi:hypothetical protein
MSETGKIAAILVADVVGYKPVRGSGSGSDARASSGPAQ